MCLYNVCMSESVREKESTRLNVRGREEVPATANFTKPETKQGFIQVVCSQN